MASKALANFQDRLKEVRQLIEAHGALVRLKKAETALAAAKGNLAGIGDVVNALVSAPKVGRPPEVAALNTAAIALLSGHLQGYITDLYGEAAGYLVGKHVPDINAVVGAAPTRGNPNENNITRLFETIGIPDVLDGISWKKMDNKALRNKLRLFNELRNKIVHGKSQTVHKSHVENYVGIWTNFASKFDIKVSQVIKNVTGSAPW